MKADPGAVGIFVLIGLNPTQAGYLYPNAFPCNRNTSCHCPRCCNRHQTVFSDNKLPGFERENGTFGHKMPIRVYKMAGGNYKTTDYDHEIVNCIYKTPGCRCRMAGEYYKMVNRICKTDNCTYEMTGGDQSMQFPICRIESSTHKMPIGNRKALSGILKTTAFNPNNLKPH